MARGGGLVTDRLIALLAERDCARAVALYAISTDTRDGKMGDLFTQDGVMETPNGSASGRDAIRAFSAQAPERATL
jgi:hypothetical protein